MKNSQIKFASIAIAAIGLSVTSGALSLAGHSRVAKQSVHKPKPGVGSKPVSTKGPKIEHRKKSPLALAK